MKLNTIEIDNFLGIKQARVQTNRPVLLFAGQNGAGKSSLRDALYVGLLEKPETVRRISKLKEFGAFVGPNGNGATISLGTTSNEGKAGIASVVIGKEKVTRKNKGYQQPEALAFVLEAQRFSLLDEKSRRRLLNDLMAVSMEPKDIEALLGKRDCNAAKVKRITPLLKIGFEAAETEAKTQATAAKGAWQAVTGEAYGSQKAEDWKAAVPDFDPATLAALDVELRHADVALRQWNENVGALRSQQTARVARAEREEQLKPKADRKARIQTKLEVDQAELARLDAEIAAVEAAAAGVPRVGTIHTMGLALKAAAYDLEGKRSQAAVEKALALYEKENGPVVTTAGGDPEAAARLPALRQARTTCASAVANDQRDLKEADDALAEIAALHKQHADDKHDPAELQAALEQVQQIQAKRADVVRRVDEAQGRKRDYEGADEKTRTAFEAHSNVLQWTKIAEALSPTGIPAELLSKALKPINDRLAQNAVDSGWWQVVVTDDVQLKVRMPDGSLRMQNLLSESEQWRCDAMIAEAIAFLSGIRLLVLDRFDVLLPAARLQLLEWLDILADTGDIDCAVVLGATKERPQIDFPGIEVLWIEDGVVSNAPETADEAQQA